MLHQLLVMRIQFSLESGYAHCHIVESSFGNSKYFQGFCGIKVLPNLNQCFKPHPLIEQYKNIGPSLKCPILQTVFFFVN